MNNLEFAFVLINAVPVEMRQNVRASISLAQQIINKAYIFN